MIMDEIIKGWRSSHLSQITLICMLLISIHHPVLANESGEPDLSGIRVERITTAPVIDGRLDEASWRAAFRISHLTQLEPEEGMPASESTEVFISYDQFTLYIGIRCFDHEYTRIVANEMRRDATLQDNDHVEIYLDTFHDHRNAFFFATNPLGTQWDGLVRNEGENLNFDWNGIWNCESTIDSLGWSTEIAIPFKSLRFNSSDSMKWGWNIGRFISRKREEDYWTPVLREYGFSGKFKVSHYGNLTGLSNITQGNGLQVKPYVAAEFERDVLIDQSYNHHLDAGLDLKYSITTNLTADLTINTDFAQVEADQEQINLTRFDLFFPEKRDFFLEGADIFFFGERPSFFNPGTILFFSRRIGLSQDGDEKIPIIGGVRATGKLGSMDVGILSVLTGQKNYINSDSEQVDVPREHSSLLRFKLPLNGNSSVGMIATNRQSDAQTYNRLLGGDWNVYLSKQTQVGGFIAKSFAPNLEGHDLAGNIDVSHETDLFRFTAQYLSIEDNFRDDLGYVPREGVQKIHFSPSIGPRPDFFNIRQTFFFDDYNHYSDQTGGLQSLYNLIGNFTVFRDGSEFFLGAFQNIEYLDEEFNIHDDAYIPTGTYRFDNYNISVETDKSRDISIRIGGTTGQFYSGMISGIDLGARWKPNIHLKLEASYQRNDIDLPIEQGIFSTNLFSGKINYAFSTKVFSKLFVQWNDDAHEIQSNFLFNYTYLAGSDIYLVINQVWDSEGHIVPRNQNVIAKFTYLLNY